MGDISKIKANGSTYNIKASTSYYGKCSTAAATAAKTVSISNFALVLGVRICVIFTRANTASAPTLNVESTGAKSIRYNNTTLTSGQLKANHYYAFIYDGTYWQLIGELDTNTTYTTATTSAAGLMSAADKEKLNNITDSADTVSWDQSTASGTQIATITINGNETPVYAPAAGTSVSYGIATATTAGLVKPKSVISTPSDVNSDTTTSGRYYNVNMDSNGAMYVNVPWVNTDTVPSVYDSRINIINGNTTFGYFTTNQSTAENITIPTFTSATSSSDGSVGLVPAPTTTDTGKFLSNEGWKAISTSSGGTTYTAGDNITVTTINNSTYQVSAIAYGSDEIYVYDSTVASSDALSTAINDSLSSMTYANGYRAIIKIETIIDDDASVPLVINLDEIVTNMGNADHKNIKHTFYLRGVWNDGESHIQVTQGGNPQVVHTSLSTYGSNETFVYVGHVGPTNAIYNEYAGVTLCLTYAGGTWIVELN